MLNKAISEISGMAFTLEMIVDSMQNLKVYSKTSKHSVSLNGFRIILFVPLMKIFFNGLLQLIL